MNKLLKLKKIAEEIENCKICKKDSSGIGVPGEGNPDAKVIFLGEAPGKQEAKTGRPFIGRSGQLLRTLIRNAGLKEEDVFITSPVKYLPDRGTPTKLQIEHGMTHTQSQIDIIDPRILVLLGASAILGILEEKIPILKKHGEIINKNDKSYFLTLHPAAALRFPPLKKILEEDFKKLLSLL